MTLRIVADRNISLVAEAFAGLGEVVTLPAAELTPAAVRDADLLLVRSTVRVGPLLLDGSRVRFVATATIGVDHLDREWLASREIRWACAPGSNAGSVVQWFAAALLRSCARHHHDPARLQAGVVGVGQVGSRIERLCRALGGPVPLACDPPRAGAEGPGGFVSLDVLLATSDLVTLHVPLEHAGAHPTFHLIDATRLQHLRPRALLVNAARGEVVDGAALLVALDAQQLDGAALDVWEHEPEPDPALVARCTVATPHIAGHSLDGKVNGTRMIYAAACDFLGVAPAWSPVLPLAAPLTLDSAGWSDAELLLRAVAAGYRIEHDEAVLRERPQDFRSYRQSYPVRREHPSVPLTFDPPRPAVEAALRSLLG